MSERSIKNFIPNLITLTGLCFGLSSIRFAVLEDFKALKSSKTANLIELRPKQSPVKVIKFGIKFLILLSDMILNSQ